MCNIPDIIEIIIPSYEYRNGDEERATRRETREQQLFVTKKEGVTSVKQTHFLVVMESASHILNASSVLSRRHPPIPPLHGVN